MYLDMFEPESSFFNNFLFLQVGCSFKNKDGSETKRTSSLVLMMKRSGYGRNLSLSTALLYCRKFFGGDGVGAKVTGVILRSVIPLPGLFGSMRLRTDDVVEAGIAYLVELLTGRIGAALQGLLTR